MYFFTLFSQFFLQPRIFRVSFFLVRREGGFRGGGQEELQKGGGPKKILERGGKKEENPQKGGCIDSQIF